MLDFFLVALGGGLGSVARFGASQIFGASPGVYTILGINLLGSYIMGAVMPWSSAQKQRGRSFLGVGVLGGFTTFSTFILEMYGLAHGPGFMQAFIYGVGGLGCGLGACWAGAFSFSLLNARYDRAEPETELENEEIS